MYPHVALTAGLALAGLALGRPQSSVIARFLPGDPAAQHLAAHHLAARHPLAVGLVTAAVLGPLGARVHPALVLAAGCALAVCAVPLAFIDAAVQRLPDALTGAAYAGTAALLLLAAASSGSWHQLVRALLGGLALAAFYFLLLLISPSGMGLGDVKLAASLGTLLAWAGWRTLVIGGFAGFGLAALYSVALLVARRATRKQQIPFGPFMVAGTFLAFLAA